MKTAIYPGSFDPPTFGHLDLIERACKLFDEVVIAIATNSSKQPIFPQELRKRLLEENLTHLPNAKVVIFESLTVDLAKQLNATAIIRGLRAVSDFEYEFQLAQMNRHLDQDIETMFLMPSEQYFYISSKLMKAVSRFSPERIAKFVPQNVLEELDKHYNGK